MSFDEMFRRAEAALFDRSGSSTAPNTKENGASGRAPEAPSQQSPGATESTAAVGENPAPRRILENLNEVDPLTALLAERAQTSRRGRKPGSKNKPKEAVPEKLDAATIANLKGRMELTPERITEALKAMERVSAAASARGARPSPAPVRHFADQSEAEHGIAGTLVVFDDDADAEPAAVADTQVTPTQVTPTQVTPTQIAPVAEARPREKASIRGRHGRGSELKPGERWKRRLRGPR